MFLKHFPNKKVKYGEVEEIRWGDKIFSSMDG